MNKLEIEEEEEGTFKVCATIGEDVKNCVNLNQFQLVAKLMQFIIIIKGIGL